MIKFRITSSGDSDLDIERGALPVVIRDTPSNAGQTGRIAIPTSMKFATKSGGINMNVNGSTAVEYSVKAMANYDFYIHRIDMRMSQLGAILNTFGSLVQLTNGLQLVYYGADFGSSELGVLKNNIDIVRLFQDTPPLGSGSQAFKMDTTGLGLDTYLFRLTLPNTFGGSNGLLLRKNSSDRLSFNVRDNLSTVTALDATAYGRYI